MLWHPMLHLVLSNTVRDAWCKDIYIHVGTVSKDTVYRFRYWSISSTVSMHAAITKQYWKPNISDTGHTTEECKSMSLQYLNNIRFNQ